MILQSADGTRLYSESLRVKNARGSLLVVHGLGEHSGRYHELAEEARSLKLDVHLFDLRGHGRSQGVRGHFTDIAEHHRDLDAWLNHLVASRDLRTDRPCYLLGHSLGGLIATTFSAQYVARPPLPEFAGLILSAPAFGIPWRPTRPLESRLVRHLPKMLRTVHVPTGIRPEDLSHDKDAVRAYREDPLNHSWITPAAFLALERAIEELPDVLPKIDLPVLFLLNGKDRVVETAAADRFAKKLSVAHPGTVEVKIFQRFFHEAFHETGKERALLELKKWILKQLLPKSKKGSSRSSASGATAKGISP